MGGVHSAFLAHVASSPDCPLPSGWGFAHGARLAAFKFSGALTSSRAGGDGEFTGTGQTCWQREKQHVDVRVCPPGRGQFASETNHGSKPVDKHVSSLSGFMFFLFEKT